MTDVNVKAQAGRSPVMGLFFSVIGLVLIVLLIGSVLCNIVLFAVVAATAGGGESETTTPAAAKFKTKVLEGEGQNKILVISLEGIIMDAKWEDGIVAPEPLRARLKQAAADKNIKAVVLKINSPGGTVSASDEMYAEIMKFKEKNKIPVLAYLDNMAASGGYYIASACDRIVSHPTTITGSIGVIMSYFDMQELFENKLGIKQMVIKSGENKDIGSPFRPLKKEQQEILDKIIMEMYERFLEIVVKGRPALANISREELLKIADGRIYTGKQAVDYKLVDSLGYFSNALEEAAKMAQLGEQKQVIEYETKKTFFQELLQGSAEAGASGLQLQQFQELMKEFRSPQFCYLWKP